MHRPQDEEFDISLPDVPDDGKKSDCRVGITLTPSFSDNQNGETL